MIQVAAMMSRTDQSSSAERGSVFSDQRFVGGGWVAVPAPARTRGKHSCQRLSSVPAGSPKVHRLSLRFHQPAHHHRDATAATAFNPNGSERREVRPLRSTTCRDAESRLQVSSRDSPHRPREIAAIASRFSCAALTDFVQERMQPARPRLPLETNASTGLPAPQSAGRASSSSASP